MVFGVFPQSDGERFCKVKRSENVCKKSVSAEIYRKHILLSNILAAYGQKQTPARDGYYHRDIKY